MNHFREPMNALTHLIGAVLSVFGIIAMLFLIIASDNVTPLTVVSVLAFGVGLVCLYGTSFTYHAAQGDQQKILHLKKLDHAMIFILIAGTYTPFCLLCLTGTMRVAMMVAIWGVALIGIVLKVAWITMPRWLGTGLYIFQGWFALFVLGPLYQALPLPGFMLLVGGGVMYTIGGVIYAIKKPNFSEIFGFHELFHIFVILGSLCHFICIFFFIL
ncbi:hemolysin III family protein [uncultured Acetobacterium sp.]|uniref:PAQR family membrane homeostasis protein TrhA n=1 Tax=uncultured Acetobacterium sp. TaxID=217139 RepID=UPI0025FAEE97|nr:hemolysin III family protein [uncultured Acetobacterium sp.]